MSRKNARIETLIEIIKNNIVGSQEELLKHLASKGFVITQATLSRDLKMLKASKVHLDHGDYTYMLPDATTAKNYTGRKSSISNRVPLNGFISVEFTGNLAVLLTRNGYASGVAYDIDMLNASEIAGTIAGANTVFIAFKEGVTHKQARDVLKRIIPIEEDQNKII